jgi:cbb3-type cytochrome oxidase subunit 3
MPILPLFCLIIIEVLVIAWLYRPLHKLEWVANICIHGFVITGSLLLMMAVDLGGFFILIPLLLFQTIGYKLFFTGGWQKALVGSLTSVASALGLAYVLLLFIRF